MITKLGKQKLEQQILDLQKELERTFDERNKAAAEGDLKENSAYIYLGEQAQLLYTQIEEAKIDLKHSNVQEAPTKTDKISFGHKVIIRFESDKREISITLVGKNDARLKPDWISCESPLGIALLDKSKSDKVLVNDQPVTILDISIGEI
ncbi:MAG: GreA/GreB family elongation factor [Candidatus Shapirobacteria bacterium]|nr:GreA/GreB family elongation factor [Candidatus Shapirobacteria bacterium]